MVSVEIKSIEVGFIPAAQGKIATVVFDLDQARATNTTLKVLVSAQTASEADNIVGAAWKEFHRITSEAAEFAKTRVPAG